MMVSLKIPQTALLFLGVLFGVVVMLNSYGCKLDSEVYPRKNGEKTSRD